MNTATAHKNRDSLLKVRVHTETKNRIIAAARALDLDQSSFIRVAIADFIARHPNAAA